MIIENVEIVFLLGSATYYKIVKVERLEYIQKPIYDKLSYEDIEFNLINNLDQNDFRRGFKLSFITEDVEGGVFSDWFFRQWLTAPIKYILVDGQVIEVVVDNAVQMAEQWGGINYAAAVQDLILYKKRVGLLDISFNIDFLQSVPISSGFFLEATARFPKEISSNYKTFIVYYTNSVGTDNWIDSDERLTFNLSTAPPQIGTSPITFTGTPVVCQFKLVNLIDSTEIYYSPYFVRS